MKKVVYWVLFVLGLVAGVLCFIYPVQAKEVCDNIMTVLNTPFAIAGVSFTLGGIIIFVVTRFIMNNSKFGRKELDSVKKDLESAKKQIAEYEYKISLRLDEYGKDYELVKNTCNNQVTIMLEQFEDLQHNVIDGLKAIPNKKVQAVVAEYESQYEVKKAEIIEKTVCTNDYIDNKLNELRQDMEKMLNEAKERINSETETA